MTKKPAPRPTPVVHTQSGYQIAGGTFTGPIVAPPPPQPRTRPRKARR